jgi:chaperonin cofactor prefoldin
MSIEPTRPTYRFKYLNYDLDRQVDECRQSASILRQDAAKLILRADQIEEEARKWEAALEECPDAP